MAFLSAALIEKIGSGEGEKVEEEEKGNCNKSTDQLGNSKLMLKETERNDVVEQEMIEEDGIDSTPLRYVPLCDVYSATTPCVSSASGGSKKVKPPHHHHRKSLINGQDHHHHLPAKPHQFSSPAVNSSSNAGCRKPPITRFYTRREKGKRKVGKDVKEDRKPENWRNSRSRGVNLGNGKGKEVVEEKEGGVKEEEEENGGVILNRRKKRKFVGGYELVNLGVNSVNLINNLDRPQCRETRKSNKGDRDSSNRDASGKIGSCSISGSEMRKRKRNCDLENEAKNLGSPQLKKWFWLSFSGVDPMKFVGLQCKVFWPLDADWYQGRVSGYDLKTGRHHVMYDDGDKEDLILSNQRVKFFISSKEMDHLGLKSTDKCSEGGGINVDEMVVLAASLDDCQELEPGDIIWAKLTGYAMWPALVSDESLAGNRKGLNKSSGEKSVLVQFFGTHDFARIKNTKIISFLRGLLSSFHLKCRKPNFVRGLEEAKMYLSEQKLPKRMLRLRSGIESDDNNGEIGEEESHTDSDEACWGNEEIQRGLGSIRSFPFEVGDLQIINLGKIVKDSDNFQDERNTWPEGYTALRKFHSITDPSEYTTYKMEVLRDDDSRTRPLFIVTSENGEQFKGPTPSSCWNKIYKRISKIQSDGTKAEVESERIFKSGVDMFGFSHPEISKLIQLSASRRISKASKKATAKYQDLPRGYRPVDVKWKDLDKCNVCHMDEEYENNLFLQCDKCRMMVHARCYGELEPMDGVLWLCNLCRAGAPEIPPPCCLCPVIGGAMKPTTDGRWAHLACAIWIPETCLSDIKKMEPIDGLTRINKDRWKLVCSICTVAYGACIQCSNSTCRVAYHPLCARAAGYCVELEDEDRLHLIPFDEDEEDQCIRLLSYCKKHRPLSNERPATEERNVPKAFEFSDYTPPVNLTGCVRTEPYNYFGRRGRKEPEAVAAASLKRLYVENRPHLVGGFSQHAPFSNNASSSTLTASECPVDLQSMRMSLLDASGSIHTMAEKYTYMRETFRKRLAFGKSGIHGFGIFAKYPHKAGDMVIEYTGEIVRAPIADRREHMIYNSLVGAGTYMFRIDDERVIDATRAGSIAHLINHSCEPNCYSRVISVNGDEHIIIFAKRDIKQWEELTYDYRFVAIDEQLPCYCGFPRCRGVVNDTEAEERAAKLYAPRRELIDWKGE